ncbi:MarR family winged helix-turn-helix transcriptional regulator [Selenihalanaerobacter shriftii]|uniref:DNA-binding transcriptional regulator, MarR family n=1 Tax=Selenihalanaerobacter shriftii TaxID=142842 RepID=A0A1T4K4U8_9FIRM|nr:MarR family transcriptional regulator [Selenihalanaerobacter shriftii]SJZ37439.1 DNA-binding transcriptional regulator, MarR family [Selenihalanaerobacter shriftii]
MQKEVTEDFIELEMLFRNIANKVNKATKDNLYKFNLNKSRLFVLIAVSKSKNITMGKLKEKMHLACSSITNLVDKLEADDLLKRERSEEDRRVIQLHLTNKGRELLNSILKFRTEYLSQALNDLTSLEFSQLQKVLQKIDNELE